MERERASKRDLIVEEASRVLYERGTGIGVDTLVSEIGVAKMTLYKHFPTKTDLIVACLRHLDDRYRSRLSHGVSAASSPRERILMIFDALQEWFATAHFRGCAFVNATVELADDSHPARSAVLEHKHATRAWVATLVDEHGVADSKLVARQIVQLMEGAITTALLEHDPTSAEVARVTASQILDAAARR